MDLKIILIRLDNEDDAYIIFETLNTRGKDLSLADLVKNHLTKYLKSQSASVDQTKIKWEKILKIIQETSIELNVDTFIHHSWLSKYNYVTLKRLFKVIKKQIKKKDAQEFLDDLIYDSKLYRQIHETSFGNWKKEELRLKQALDALMLFKVRQQTPCVLSLVRAYKLKQIKKKHLESALISIEKFHYFFTAITSQRSSGGISYMYASLARRIYLEDDKDALVTIISELQTKLRDRVPTQKEVDALYSEHYYTKNYTKERPLIRYMLIKHYKAEFGHIGLDYNHMTIEHLIPQSLIGTNDTYTDEKIGQIGNLILVTTDVNNELDDKNFEQKKTILKDYDIVIPKSINDASSWSIEDIDIRTSIMSQVAYDNIWKM